MSKLIEQAIDQLVQEDNGYVSQLDLFLKAYVEAALWSSTDDKDVPLDKYHTAKDLAPETVAKMKADCQKFLVENDEDIGIEYERAGHDFWLTRNGHGAGFWDGDWEEEAGERLTKSAHAFGQADLYIGDDGKIYQG